MNAWADNIFNEIFIENYFLIDICRDDNVFLDDEEIEKSIYYSLGSASYFRTYFGTDLYYGLPEAKDNLFTYVLKFGMESNLTKFEMKLLKDAFFKPKSDYTQRQSQSFKQGKRDIKSWLKKEELVLQNCCKCSDYSDSYLITKNQTNSICKSCNAPFEYIEYLFDYKKLKPENELSLIHISSQEVWLEP